MPAISIIRNEQTASVAVTEMLPVAVAMYGNRPSRLQKRIMKNAVRQYGTYFSPWCPTFGRMTSLRR